MLCKFQQHPSECQNQEQTQEGQEWSVKPEAIGVIQERDDAGLNQGDGPGDAEKGSSWASDPKAKPTRLADAGGVGRKRRQEWLERE